MTKTKTVVLMWNPSISSVKDSDYNRWFGSLCTFSEQFFNWSVWDWEHTGYGDRFVLVLVGDDNGGLVMDGLVSSDSREGDDWAGTDRKRRYVDLIPMRAFNPLSNAEYPSQAQLQEAVPDFDWAGGHSGRILSDEQAANLDTFLDGFYSRKEVSEQGTSKMRSRDYLVSPRLILPDNEEQKRCRPVPSSVIENLIGQCVEVPTSELEEKWKQHCGMWVKGHEDLLRTAAWLAYPSRQSLPCYGALCFKIAIQYFGKNNERINAAYAKEAADHLSDPSLRHQALMHWLGDSLRARQNWGTNHAVDPMIAGKVSGIEALSDFCGFDVLHQDDMLHDFYLRKVDVSFADDTIDLLVSDEPDGDQSEILTFHLSGNVSIETDVDTDGYLYIDGAQIGPWGKDRVQLTIDGYGLCARARRIDITLN